MSKQVPSKDTIKNVITAIVDNNNREWYTKTASELDDYWHFKWDDTKSLQHHLYQFFHLLELYRHNCEQWEVFHNGHICMVERVRDKYILPKIDELIAIMKKDCGNDEKK